MSPSKSTPTQRYEELRPALGDALDRLRGAIERWHPGATACLPVPELTVPAADGFDAGCKALFANLFADNGSRSAIWIAALDACPEGRETAIEVFELIYFWYQLVCAASYRVRGIRDMAYRFENTLEMLPRRLGGPAAGREERS